MPAQQRVRSDEERLPSPAGEQLRQDSEDRTVRRSVAHSSMDLTLEDAHFVAEHHELDVLVDLGSARGTQQAEESTENEIAERQGHGGSSPTARRTASSVPVRGCGALQLSWTSWDMIQNVRRADQAHSEAMDATRTGHGFHAARNGESAGQRALRWAGMGSLQNRRLRLPRLESWTCHYLRKRPVAWGSRDSRAGAFGPARSRRIHRSPDVYSCARTHSAQRPGRIGGPPGPLTRCSSSAGAAGASGSPRSLSYGLPVVGNSDRSDGPDLRQL
jgi:hypothetical protein